MSRNFNSNIDWFNQPNSLTYDFDRYKWYEDEEDKVPTNTMNNYGNSITSLLTPTLSGGVSKNTKTTNNSGWQKDVGDVVGLGKDAYDLFGTLSSGSGSGGPSWIGAAVGGTNALKTLGKTGSFRDAGQTFFNIDAENDSEIMQALKGASSGAQMGAGFGPWGALIGGVLGLGASFLDDI